MRQWPKCMSTWLRTWRSAWRPQLSIWARSRRGLFAGEVIFRIDANTRRPSICRPRVTNLYKGDSPTAESIIPVATALGVLVEPENGNEIAAGDNILAYEDTAASRSTGFAGLQTEIGTFESGQTGHFSQHVFVTFAWNQIDPELPMGEYSGFCMLRGMVLPTGPRTIKTVAPIELSNTCNF